MAFELLTWSFPNAFVICWKFNVILAFVLSIFTFENRFGETFDKNSSAQFANRPCLFFLLWRNTPDPSPFPN